MKNENIFCYRVRELRQLKNITQGALGEIMGITAQSVNDIERGRNKTSLDRAVILAKYFNVSLDYLVGLTDDPESNK